MSALFAWAARHEIIAWIIAWAIVLPLLRKRTPAEWVDLATRKPRWQGIVRMMRGAGFDPAKVLSGFIQFLTGRVRAAGLTDEITPAQAADLARQKISDASKSTPRVPTLPLLMLLCLALSGCYHRDGRAFTGPEYTAAARQVWKFTLDGVRAACELVRGPAGTAATVLIDGAAVPVLVARAACEVVDLAAPRAVGIVVVADGENATANVIARQP